MIIFSQALPYLTELEVINFDDCLIRSDGAKVLAKSLAETDYHHLKVLSVTNYLTSKII